MFLGVFYGCVNAMKAIRSTIKLGIKLYDKGDMLFETQYWYASLKNDQTYLGSAFLRLRRVESNFGNLTNEEMLELLKIIDMIERTTKKIFGSSHANWFCLMNHAYRIHPPIPLVHIHLHPRYMQQKIIFAGYEFTDNAPAELFESKDVIVPDSVRKEIIRAYQEEFRNYELLPTNFN